jgi:predicted RNA polymerase sigma factor
VSALSRHFGDLDIAEEAAAAAFTTAVERWPADGVPPNPGAWPTTTATRKAIDRIPVETPRAAAGPAQSDRPNTRMRSSASDGRHCTVIGRRAHDLRQTSHVLKCQAAACVWWLQAVCSS